MKYRILFSILIGSLAASLSAQQIAIVDFSECIQHSKYGKKEQESFESLRKQMATLIEDVEKQMKSLADKFNDADYLDSLSPEAEQELKGQFQTLNEELNRYQNQYYQVMNQANMRLIQAMTQHVGEASEKISKSKNLSFVLNKEACFFYDPKYNITNEVIKTMDQAFDKDQPSKVETKGSPAK